MKLTVAKIGNHPTVSFALDELCRLIKAMDKTVVLDKRRYDSFDESLQNIIWVGMGFTEEAEQDFVYIDVKDGAGVISGSNLCSVLIAVYRFMTELGCRFLYPGKDGEKIPQKKLDYSDLRVYVTEKASYHHRTICIEGHVGYEHVVNTIDWLPKVGMSGYFTQFLTPTSFFRTYYRKFTSDSNDIHYKNDITDSDVDAIMECVKEEIIKRSLRYHTGGHVWIGRALGLASTGWDECKEEISDETRNLLAMMDGKRDFYQGAVSCTNLCYSNPKAREKVADAVVSYCDEHREVKYIHFWLADHPNNHCECDECKKKIPTDFYVLMLNEIDEKLTAKKLDTKITCAVYNEIMWAPVTEKIKNPDRFILDFAPISRSYSYSYDEIDFEKPVELAEYERNNIKGEKEVEKLFARLKEWRKQNVKESYAFEYHLMWDHHYDPGYMDSAKMLYRDIKDLKRLGLDGYVSCQLLRCAFPTGLPQYTMAKTLWNRDVSFDSIADEYYTAAFKEDADAVKEYMNTLSVLFEPEVLRADKPFDKDIIVPQFEKAKAVIDEFNEKYIEKNKTLSRDWEFLSYHTVLAKIYADIYIARFLGEEEKCKEHFEKFGTEYKKIADSTDEVLDDFLGGTVYNNLFGWRKRF